MSRQPFGDTFPDAPQLLTVRQVAELAGVCKETVYEWISAGEIPSVDLGHGRAKTRINAADYRAFVEARTTRRKSA